MSWKIRNFYQNIQIKHALALTKLKAFWQILSFLYDFPYASSVLQAKIKNCYKNKQLTMC